LSTLYFDSAYIAKCYLSEPDALPVRRLVESTEARYSSAWCLAEMACIFHRQIRERSLTTAQMAVVRSLFESDVAAGL
jgi:predicted nucleic acid-binding protein